MLIDWFTVGAQTLNFLILVWLLKRFLYQPILNALDTREQKIAAELADADTKRTEAEKQQAHYERKNAEFDLAREALMEQASSAADAEKRKLVQQARQTAADLHSQQQQALSREQDNVNATISRYVEEEVFAITRKVLADLASSSLEQSLLEMFVQRLQNLDKASYKAFAHALQTDTAPLRLRTAFTLTEAQQTLLREAIQQTFKIETPLLTSRLSSLQYDTDKTLISGIELSSNGHKLSWSIADYLHSMEQSIGEVLDHSMLQYKQPHEEQNKEQYEGNINNRPQKNTMAATNRSDTDSAKSRHPSDNHLSEHSE